jgi:hypothetical protein
MWLAQDFVAFQTGLVGLLQAEKAAHGAELAGLHLELADAQLQVGWVADCWHAGARGPLFMPLPHVVASGATATSPCCHRHCEPAS